MIVTQRTAAPKPADPERPTAPSRAVPGREADVARAIAARDVLLSLTRGDERLRGDIERALIAAGVVEVAR